MSGGPVRKSDGKSVRAETQVRKWNKEAEGAIKQIKDRNYPKILTNYGGRIVLVGINYHEDTKSHECLIEEYRKADLDTAGR